MKIIRKTMIFSLIFTLFLCCFTTVSSAAIKIPSETDAFVDDYYLEETNQGECFVETILPEIKKNIKENNKHSINPHFDKRPTVKNPENFQGLGHVTYNVNGGTVTVEPFFRIKDQALYDPNCGNGLLIYQAIEYKKAHPEEDVKIAFGSYRTSVTAAVCVVPGSRYYGYMRSLFGINYDEHGFVRVSYLLTEAARMGIEVTMVNQLNASPSNQWNETANKVQKRQYISMDEYFARAKETACYDKYAKGKKVSDFLEFHTVGWNSSQITQNMQHLKGTAVSHYLATDGTEHKNTVYLSSANLDESDYRGANGLNSVQSGVIISDHEQIYRSVYNYTQLIADHAGQDEVYEFRNIVLKRNAEQQRLIKAGRANEIPSDEQILYLGTKKDTVFRLYLMPLAATVDGWDAEYHPYCEYVDKMAASEDYVEFVYNIGGQISDCNLTDTLIKKLNKAFCDNANNKNKLCIRAIDVLKTDAIEELKLGSQIGYRSIKKIRGLHTKDMLMSYVEDGVRHNVSLLASSNFYPDAFSYRSNSVLVIDETKANDGGFYHLFGDEYSYGMLDGNLTVHTANLTLEKGDSHKLDVEYSGKNALEWSSSKPSVATVSNGTVKAIKPGSAKITVKNGDYKKTVSLKVVDCLNCENKGSGQKFNTDEQFIMSKKYSSTPLTFETELSVKQSSLKDITTILGSDDGYEPSIIFALNKSGNPRIAIRDKAGRNTAKAYVFKNVNVATGKKTHLGITIDFKNKKMHCYVNGKLQQSVSISSFSTFNDKYAPVIGGDYKNGNASCFTGSIYSIALWSDQRTAAEIESDYKNGVSVSDANLMAAYDLTRCKDCMLKDKSENENDLKHLPLWLEESDVEPVGNFEYSFAIVGDTQTMCETDPEAMESIYDWIAANKASKRIKYVIGLGDITEDSTDREWSDATSFISKLNGVLPYSLCRGNHDDLDDFNKYLNDGVYNKTLDGQMKSGDLTNSYRYLSVHGTDYLIMTLDFAPNGATLEWANNVIKKHPKHKVIITTHAYMYRDGSTIDAGDLYPPTYYEKDGKYADAQNGDDMWKKCFSKHKNVVLVLSGHDPWQHIVYRQDKGEKGNYVTQMLIDPQYVDKYNGSVAMVAMMYFSNNGNTITMRYYSVEKGLYGSPLSQFTIDLNDHKHTYSTTYTDATLTKNGKIVSVCSTCDDVKEEIIYSPADFKLSTASYVYNGGVRTPAVTVKDSKGNVLKKDTDYSVSYESGRINAGTYDVNIAFKGKYTGAKTVTFKITPAKLASYALSTKAYTYNGKAKTPAVTVKDSKGNVLKKDTDYTVSYEKGRILPGKYSVHITGKGNYTGKKELVYSIKAAAPKKISAKKRTNRQIVLTWTKVKGADGYYVSKYNPKTKKYVRIKTIKNGATVTHTAKFLKPGTKYSFKVRAYTNDNGVIAGKLPKAYTTATKTNKPWIKKIKSNAKGKVNLTWSNVNGESGYQVFYSTKKNANYKKASNFKANVVKGVKGKLKSGKVYYFKVRTYKQTPTGTVYSAWSKAKRVKVK